MNINAKDQTIRQLFGANNKFIVPRFQRAYCWESEQVTQLWNDILDNIKTENNNTNIEDYFIGSLVLIGPLNTNEYLIIDGQQRLTTLVIFLSALTERFKKSGADSTAKGLYSLLEGSDIETNKPFFKVINETPSPFFQQAIQAFDKVVLSPNGEEEKALLAAYSIANKKIDEIEKKYLNKAEELQKYFGYIRQAITQLKLVVIDVDNEDDAYTIFETLNSTGKDLTVVDLIKNYAFRVLNEQHPVDEAEIIWNKIQENLKNRNPDQDFVQFFLHYWKSATKDIGKKDLYKSFKKEIGSTEQSESKEKIKLFLASLEQESKNYSYIIKPSIHDWTSQSDRPIYESLKALSGFYKVTQVRVLLMALMYLRDCKRINFQDFKEGLGLLENFTFVFNRICSARPSGLEGKFSNYSRRLRKAHNKNEIKEILASLREDLRNKVPSKETFREKFGKVWFTNDNDDDKPLVQYILKKIEKYYQPTDEIEFLNLSIEHIVPQSNLTFKKHSGKIGNLLPLSGAINKDADILPFLEKKKYYSLSQYESVKAFLKCYEEEKEWTCNHIDKRTSELADLAYDYIWKI